MSRIEIASKEGLCVACMQPLNGRRSIRGCHVKCHRATLRAIERGETTEAKRVEEGKFLAPQKGGRPRSNPVSLDTFGGEIEAVH